MNLDFFQNTKALTLGVEIELQVLDRNSLLLTPRASEIIAKSGNPNFKQEFFQSTLEIITDICDDVHDVERDLRHSVKEAIAVSKTLELTLAATGTNPVADYRDRLVTALPRYSNLIDRNQWLTRRMAVYGMHIHIGMASGNSCIEFSNFFIHFIPHIIALSASSPFWQGMSTGLSSCRPTTYEALPTAGMPYIVNDWMEFSALYERLIKSDSIQTIRDLWWDIRPSPGFGTLEIRCCDQPATLSEVLAITAFIHLLAEWFTENKQRWTPPIPSEQWVLRENKWRAMRYGIDAEIITNNAGEKKKLSDDIRSWIMQLEVFAQKRNYSHYMASLVKLLKNGTSSQRQSQVFEKTNNLMDVVQHNVREFVGNQPEFLSY